MKATIWLLGIWFATLLVEVPYVVLVVGFPGGLSAAVGPVIIEAIFMILMIVFIIYGGQVRRWSYIGVTIIGALHAILSASIYFGPGGPPLPAWALLAVGL